LESLDLHGYVLKRGSPSCGLFRVRLYDEAGDSHGNATGAFAGVLTEHFPGLPGEEEGRLSDPALREDFIERGVAMARGRGFLARRPRAGDLVAFHAAQKFAVLAHSPSHYARLGRLVAAAGGGRLAARMAEYGALLMQALSIRATRARHTNVLQHLAGFFK